MNARPRIGGSGLARAAAMVLLALSTVLAAASLGGATGSDGVALRVVSESPSSNSLNANGAGAIVVTFDQVLSSTGTDPTITPPVAGVWARSRTELVFRPAVAMPPETLEKVVVPDGRRGVTARDGATLATPIVFQFATRSGSVLRAEQILATLGYLPLRFVARGHARLDAAAAARAVYLPLKGRFVWRWPAPRPLTALWSPGRPGPMLTGAVMAFERDRGDPLDGQLGGTVWSQLLAAGQSPHQDMNRGGYTYALASKADPETLVVFHDGVPVVQTDVNTGLSAAPTPDGTFTVYERLANQVMKGVTPWGTTYADPVSWVAYFHGSDAIHYISRGTYGYPQSLGCVEVPYSAAARAWPYLTIGSLVTVEG